MTPGDTPCLAYAGDFILLADSGKDAEALLVKTTSFFSQRGFEVNLLLDSYINCLREKKVFHHTTPTFKIGNTDIKPLSVPETFK